MKMSMGVMHEQFKPVSLVTCFNYRDRQFIHWDGEGETGGCLSVNSTDLNKLFQRRIWGESGEEVIIFTCYACCTVPGRNFCNLHLCTKEGLHK